ncbi:hypothetical protein [Sphingomonas sp. BK345]|uniref:hypothetical protein n=1 Tax=Sphingomonas sp. BK345 TaxID=2586980 RepID=UPI00160C6C3A|nr:hypothetical protein [Sphingomonas sp. BK345]MBB3472944.1 hypothetical protein [Sphingomonas sp. BK345]
MLRAAALTFGLLLPAAVMAQTPADTRFRRDPALMRVQQAQLVAAIKAKDPATAAALETAFRQDVVEAVRPAFQRFGFSPDDAADMTAAYWITAWEAAHGQVGVETDPAIARGVRAQLAGVLGPKLRGRGDAEKQEIADTMLLQMLFADARMRAAKAGGDAKVRAMSDAIHAEASELLKTDLRQVEMTASGFKPVAAATEQDTGPAPGSGRTPPVSGLYFRAIAGGAGVSYEPLVFFTNGDYVELDETPLVDLDAAADRARSPARWGTWRKQGETFLLTSSKGRTSDYRLGLGSFFPAFTADRSPLSGTYKLTSGSTVYMADGPVSTLGVSRLTFAADGTFTQGAEGGGVAPTVAVSSRAAQRSGRWKLSGTMLELTYADGRQVRKSFVWAAQGTPPRPDPDMAFIGGDPFLRDR